MSALSGCGSITGSTSDSGKIQFWNLFTGPDGALMKKMTRSIEDRVPELKVRSTVLDWGPPYYTKLAMASAGGRSPTWRSCTSRGSRATRRAVCWTPGTWTCWPSSGAAAGPERDGPQAGVFQGEQYAIPLDTHPFIIYFNRDMMDKAGLLDGDGRPVPFESPQHYLELADKLRKDSGARMGPVFGFVNDAAMAWRMFWTLYYQTGATLDLTGSKAEIDQDTAVKVVQFMADLVREDARTMDLPTAIAAFANGQSPLIFSGEWDLGNYQPPLKDKLGAAPFPTFYERPGGATDSHSLVLPHQDSADADRRRRSTASRPN
ncbi:extracellular solute-binding protein [Streptomyces sp. M19]